MRAEAVTKVSSQIIANGALLLKARTYYGDRLHADQKIPQLLTEGTPKAEAKPK